MSTDLLPVFVYGTLRNGLGNYERLLRGKTVHEEPAVLVGATMYDAGGCPFVSREGTGTVLGEVMYLDPETAPATMLGLDRLEGFHGTGEPGNMYERVRVEVLTNNLTMLSVYVYVTGAGFAEWNDAMPVIASGDWKNRRAVAVA